MQKVDQSKLFELIIQAYGVDRKLHRQEEFCRAMLLRCNASCVPQRCGLNVSYEMNEIVQEFNVVTEQSKILGIFDILEAAANATYNKPCVRYDERAGGACTVQNGAVTVASQEGHIRLIFEGVFIAVFLTSIPFQSKIPMARPGYSRGSRHGRIECTRISWSGAT